MKIDFPLILVLAVLVSGFFWLLDKFFLEPRRNRKIATGQNNPEKQAQPIKAHGFIELCRSVFPVLLLVFVVRSFLFEPFQIPSGSMIPTLQIGDFILVKKYDYGLRLPVLGTNIVPLGSPKAGDVMVFKVPKIADPNQPDYIKRVIGVPGDHIAYYGKQLFINGKKVKRKLLKHINGPDGAYNLYQETLNQHTYTIQLKDDTYISPYSGEGDWVVPPHHYFMMGDNRDNSFDSRFWGFVPDNNVVGHAFFIWLHWPSWTQLPNFSTVGSIE